MSDEQIVRLQRERDEARAEAAEQRQRADALDWTLQEIYALIPDETDPDYDGHRKSLELVIGSIKNLCTRAALNVRPAQENKMSREYLSDQLRSIARMSGLNKESCQVCENAADLLDADQPAAGEGGEFSPEAAKKAVETYRHYQPLAHGMYDKGWNDALEHSVSVARAWQQFGLSSAIRRRRRNLQPDQPTAGEPEHRATLAVVPDAYCGWNITQDSRIVSGPHHSQTDAVEAMRKLAGGDT